MARVDSKSTEFPCQSESWTSVIEACIGCLDVNETAHHACVLSTLAHQPAHCLALSCTVSACSSGAHLCHRLASPYSPPVHQSRPGLRHPPGRPCCVPAGLSVWWQVLAETCMMVWSKLRGPTEYPQCAYVLCLLESGIQFVR